MQNVPICKNALTHFFRTLPISALACCGLILLISFTKSALAVSSCTFSSWHEVSLSGLNRTDFAPTVVSIPSRNEIYAFIRSRDAGIIYYKSPTSTWTPLLGLDWGLPGGAPVASEPAATLFGDQIFIVVRGIDGRIYQERFTPSTGVVSNWTEIPGDGRTVSGPAVVAYGDPLTGGGFDYFVTGANNRVWVNRYSSFFTLSGSEESWSGWSEIPGGIQANGGPTAVIFEGQTHVFVRGYDDHVYENVDSASGWRGWVEVQGNGRMLDKPGAVVYGIDRQLHLFARGYDNRVYQQTKDQFGMWNSGWNPVPGGGHTMAAPAAATTRTGVLHLFVKWHEERVFRNMCYPPP